MDVEAMNCEECDGVLQLDGARREMVCTQCSLVSSIFEFGTEVTNDVRETISVNTRLPETRIYNEFSDANGAALGEIARNNMKRLAWLNTHSLGKRDRSMKRLFTVSTDVCRKLQLSRQLSDRITFLSREIYDTGILRNQEFSLIVGAAVKLAMQESKAFLDEKALLRVLVIARNRPEAQLWRAYRESKRALKMYALRTTSQSLLPRAASVLELPANVQRKTRELLESFEAQNRPEVDLAAAIFAASRISGFKVKQVDVAVACKTTDVSLRSRVKKLWPEVLVEK